MARLLSVNVGLPRNITWQGRTVYTAVWKTPVQGRRMVGRLNVDGDGQGDLDRYFSSMKRASVGTFFVLAFDLTAPGKEDPAGAQKKRYVGSVVWRTETISPEPARHPSLRSKPN
jgi:hypothetical protein